MSLLNPYLLVFGAISVAVPIIIHLLNRRKFERVVWAAMRFLRVSVEQNQRRIQMEDILLLILRCLILLLLGLALARPTFGCAAAGAFGQGSVTGVIVLDNSYSMSGTDGVKSRFEQAKMAADQVIGTMPGGSSVAVILASDIADAVIPEPTHDLLKVRRTISEARLSGRPTNLYPSIKAALDTLKGRSALRKEIYVLTDGQLVAWRQLGEVKRALEAEKADSVSANIILVGAKEDQNLGVSQLRMASAIAATGRPLRFEVQVTNYGADKAENVRVSFRVDNDPPSDEQTISEIAAGTSKSIALTAQLRDEGYHTVTAAIPADHLPADDTRTIALRAVKEVRVLMVDGNPASLPAETETYFLRNGLVRVAPAARDQYYLKVTTTTPAELDLQKLDGFDAIAFCDVPDVSPRTLDALASYLRRGLGGLIIFPGPNTQPTFYNDRMSGEYHFLPATLGTIHGDTERRDKFFSLQDKKFEHPIASIWDDPGAGSPSAAHFWKVYDLIPAEDTLKDGEKPKEGDKSSALAAEAGPPRVVLRWGPGTGQDKPEDHLDGKPAVMERNWGLGRVILFSSTASNKWTTLPVTPQVWLPLIDRVLNAAITRQDEALNLKVGDKFVYHPLEDLIGKEALIFKPGQKEEANDSRRVEVSKAGIATLSYDGADAAGEYFAKFPGDTQAQTASIKFATQIDTQANESTLEEINQPQKDSLAQVAAVTHWQPGDPMGARIEKARVGTELWLPIAIMVLVLATAETFLAHWFSRTK